MSKLSIIIPVFNEEKTIETVLEKISGLNLPAWEKEIIVVDDGSKDNSKFKMSTFSRSPTGRQNFILLFHENNKGKGEAVKTALKEAGGEYVLIQDADLEYDPDDIPNLLREVVVKNYPAVYGSRNLKPERRGYPHYVLGVKILTGLVNFIFGTRLTDIYTGYKLVRTDILKSLNLESRGFEFEAELTVKLLKAGFSITELPIHYYPRSFKEGKKINFRDGLKGLWTIWKKARKI